MNSEQQAIREVQEHHFAGSFPQIATYSDVNLHELLAGDNDPFFITLALAEIGRVSSNGLLYDEALVESIAEQLKGSGGIRGHIPDGQESTAFPIDAVDWVGHQIIDKTLWAKAYVRPGETRDHIRRLKARGGSLGTSIYGFATREIVDEEQGIWRASPFELHSVDLAPAKMASLQMGGEFQISAETEQAKREAKEEEPAMLAEMRLEDVPERIREQIIEQARLASELARVQEIQAHVDELQSQVAEFERQIGEQNRQMEELSAAREAAEARLSEYEISEFQSRLAQRIKELSDWQVESEAGKNKLAALRQRLTRDVQSQMAESRDLEALETALTEVWEDNALIIATVRESLAGPNINFSDQSLPKEGSSEWLKSEEGIAELKKKYGAK